MWLTAPGNPFKRAEISLLTLAMFSQRLSEQDELFKFISAPLQQETMLQQKKLRLDPSPCNNTDTNSIIAKPKRGRRRKASAAFGFIDDSPAAYLKKMIHRDVERQRRQEMADLYQSLRSIIPSEHLEGKRSISDHVDVTVRYITLLQKKMDELNSKRNKLQEMLNPSSSKAALDCFDQTSITVKTCKAGVEVNVNTGSNGGLPLSRVLNVLTLENLFIRSCISTPINERMLHIIESEGNGQGRIDLNGLQQKLMSLFVLK